MSDHGTETKENLKKHGVSMVWRMVDEIVLGVVIGAILPEVAPTLRHKFRSIMGMEEPEPHKALDEKEIRSLEPQKLITKRHRDMYADALYKMNPGLRRSFLKFADVFMVVEPKSFASMLLRFMECGNSDEAVDEACERLTRLALIDNDYYERRKWLWIEALTDHPTEADYPTEKLKAAEHKFFQGIKELLTLYLGTIRWNKKRPGNKRIGKAARSLIS